MKALENTHEEKKFIDGRGQIIEMLKFMNPNEKQILLKNMRPRNAQLVDELSKENISYRSLFELSDEKMHTALRKIPSIVIGLSLKDMDVHLQKKTLSHMSTERAEKAFKMMNTAISNKNQVILKARNKISKILESLISIDL